MEAIMLEKIPNNTFIELAQSNKFYSSLVYHHLNFGLPTRVTLKLHFLGSIHEKYHDSLISWIFKLINYLETVEVIKFILVFSIQNSETQKENLLS